MCCCYITKKVHIICICNAGKHEKSYERPKIYTHKTTNDVNLLVMVQTAPNSFSARKRIRHQWGLECKWVSNWILCYLLLKTEFQDASVLLHNFCRWKTFCLGCAGWTDWWGKPVFWCVARGLCWFLQQPHSEDTALTQVKWKIALYSTLCIFCQFLHVFSKTTKHIFNLIFSQIFYFLVFIFHSHVENWWWCFSCFGWSHIFPTWKQDIASKFHYGKGTST